MKEYWKAFDDFKSYLNSSPSLGRLDLDEELFLYLATFLLVMSIVLIQEKDKVQKPVYYISKILRDI